MEDIGISATLSFDCSPLYIKGHYQSPKQASDKTLVVAGSVAYTESGAEKIFRYVESMSQDGFKIKVLVGAAAFPAGDDKSFVNFLKNQCKAPWELVEAKSLEMWLDTINKATLVVSGRFYHSIAAFCLNTPFIALNSNTPKIHSICAFLHQPDPLHYSDSRLLEKLHLRTQEILSNPVVDNGKKASYLRDLARKNFDGLIQYQKR